MVSGTDLVSYEVATFKGLPYTWGKNDCSGIQQQTFAHFGINIPRVSSQQWGAGVPISEAQLQPGDLVFYDPGTSGAPPGEPGHVAMYVGNGMTFQALNQSTPIGFGTVHDPNLTLMGFRRMPGVNGAGPGSNGTSDSAPPVPQHSGSTCALGFHDNIPVIPHIYTQTVGFCLLSKSGARSFIGAGLLALGGGVLLVGTAIALSQTQMGKTVMSGTVMGKAASLGSRAGGGKIVGSSSGGMLSGITRLAEKFIK